MSFQVKCEVTRLKSHFFLNAFRCFNYTEQPERHAAATTRHAVACVKSLICRRYQIRRLYLWSVVCFSVGNVPLVRWPIPAVQKLQVVFCLCFVQSLTTACGKLPSCACRMGFVSLLFESYLSIGSSIRMCAFLVELLCLAHRRCWCNTVRTGTSETKPAKSLLTWPHIDLRGESRMNCWLCSRPLQESSLPNLLHPP